MKAYNLREGTTQHRFHCSAAKIRIFGGGFGNGKTTAAVIEVLTVAQKYPGANILVARSTYPKLNDTIRKEILNWCPKSWVKRKPTKDNNTLVLTNGSEINFRYIQQQGKQAEDGSTTSNLLSATYDFIVVDQIEDPEISYKDFTDLLGRLRGTARCIDNSSPWRTMPWPDSGPRMMIITCNPTRNWVFRRLVKPIQMYRATGFVHPELIVDPDTNKPMIELFEGPTHENENLAQDFITGLEATYKGQMRDRFLLGLWAAYEGLVYPQFDPSVHIVPRVMIEQYLRDCITKTIQPEMIEGYDFGLSSPSCYLQSFTDHCGNVMLLNGFYEREASPDAQAGAIFRLRARGAKFARPSGPILADPAIFRRQPQGGKIVGRSVSSMFFDDHGISMRRGNNDIINGIAKVQSYMNFDKMHRNPFTGALEAPRFYVCEDLTFFIDEIEDYFWKKHSNDNDELTEKPMDRRDHAMDALKYMFSYKPSVAQFHRDLHRVSIIPTQWTERDDYQDPKAHRYGYGRRSA